jgi:DNA-binding NarL/FixJ family response regulator
VGPAARCGEAFRARSAFAASCNDGGVIAGDPRAMALSCMIVDDNEEFLASARAFLEAGGVRVAGVATNAAAGLALAEELAPDVVLVDVELGPESGFDAAQALAANTTARIVMISTHSRGDLEELLERSPAVGFVPKAQLAASAIVELLT